MTSLPLTAESDQALLARYRARRDPQVFAQIVARYAGAVYAACRRVLGDATAAEDAAQETFYKLLRHPEAVDHSLGGWLHRTATRLAIDSIRRDSRRRRREQVHAQSPPAPGSAPGRELNDWQELSPELDEALVELPHELQWVLVQHYLCQRSLRDLAQESGSSPATMSRRLNSALEALRGHLRRRGLLASVAVLAALLAAAPAQAAPPALLRELGKMSLYQAAAGAGAAVSTAVAGGWLSGWKAGMLLFAGGISLAAVVTLVLLAASLLPNLAEPAPAAAPTTQVAPDARAGGNGSSRNGAAPEPRYIFLPAAAGTLDASRIATFQDPRTAEEGKLAVVFGDGHVRTLPVAEVRRLVETQTGRRWEELLR